MSKIDWRSLKSSKFYGLNIPQAIIVGAVGLWLVISLTRETIFLSYMASLWKGSLLAWLTFIPATAIAFLGAGVPVLLAVWFYRNMSENHSRGPARLPIHKALASQMEGPIGLLGMWLLAAVPTYILFEAIGHCSVMPLVTPLCSILAGGLGYWLLKRMSFAKKLTVLALAVAAALASEYVDWYPAKPLVRDMWRIKAGMTVAEVDAVMADHKVTPGGPIDEKDVAQTGEGYLYYGTPFSVDGVNVKITDGRVEDVAFEMD
jgi:hypothetical protein